MITLELSLIAGRAGAGVGTDPRAAATAAREGDSSPVRFLTIAYIDVFRGIPLLMVILLISGSLAVPAAARVDPIPHWFGKPDPFWYGVMALTITYGAYMAEVYRAGIEAVPRGQMEAARSLGMSHGQAMRNVIVPQAVRKVIAPLLNDFIALMKDTTLVGVIALNEVVLVGRDIQVEDLQQLGADARRDHVPGRHHAAGAAGRLADLAGAEPIPAAARLGSRRCRYRHGASRCSGWRASTSASATSRCCGGSTSRSRGARSSA